jgi:CheY-like chemotaxis protein
MKCHNFMSPAAPDLPVQKLSVLYFNLNLNAEDRAPGTRPEFSESIQPQQNPSSALAAQEEESCLIYVVDDEPGLTGLYTILLEQRGYVVRAFESRIEALAQLKGDRRKPDLLIMDYFGHSMSVDGFIQRCLLAHPALRILVASGFSPIDARFAQVRPDRFIQKPFTADEFLLEVEAALSV